MLTLTHKAELYVIRVCKDECIILISFNMSTKRWKIGYIRQYSVQKYKSSQTTQNKK